MARLITSTVSTLATTPNVVNFVMTRSGLLRYVSSDGGTVSSVDTTTGAVTVLAGVYGAYSFADGVGTAARFYKPRGVALNDDETLLYVADWYNYRLRQVVLSNLSVTTAAGTGDASSVNGPLLSSTFLGPAQTKWYCDRLTSACGVMLVDFATSGGIRWIPITPGSISISASAPACENLSSTKTQQFSLFTPSPSSSLEATSTKSPPTRTKSSTLFDCNAQAPQATGVMLVGVNSSLIPPTQLPMLRNTSVPLALIRGGGRCL